MEISEKDHMKQKVNKYQTVAGEISESRDYMKPNETNTRRLQKKDHMKQKGNKYQTVAGEISMLEIT